MSLQSHSAMSFVAVLILLVSIARPTIGFHIAQPMTTSSRVQQWRRTPPLFVAAPLMGEEMDQHSHHQRGGVGKIVEIESPNDMAECIAEDDRLCIVK